MPVKDLGGRGSSVRNGPMINSCVRNETNSAVCDPFPEYNICVINMGFDLLLRFNIEDLERASGYVE
jgi:hypothetical protein